MPHLERMLKRALSCLSDVRTISKPPYLREAVASLEASEIIRNGQVIALCSGSQRVVDQWSKG